MYKALFFIVVFIFSYCSAFTQKTEKQDENKIVFEKVQVEAQFNGGINQWIQYLQQNLKAELGEKYIPIGRGQKKVVQSAMVLFSIDTLGNVIDVTVENPKEIHPKLAEEAVRVIKSSPKWTPAVQNGRKVIFRHKQRISFASEVQ